MRAEAWGHSVADLLKELAKKHDVPDELADVALELDKAYIPTRHPNVHLSGSPRSRYTKGEARRLKEYAERIVKFCSDLLSSQKRCQLIHSLIMKCRFEKDAVSKKRF